MEEECNCVYVKGAKQECVLVCGGRQKGFCLLYLDRKIKFLEGGFLRTNAPSRVNDQRWGEGGAGGPLLLTRAFLMKSSTKSSLKCNCCQWTPLPLESWKRVHSRLLSKAGLGCQHMYCEVLCVCSWSSFHTWVCAIVCDVWEWVGIWQGERKRDRDSRERERANLQLLT